MNRQGIFNFKQFSISHTNSSMKVGTDAVLLGSWVDVSNTKKILDIGTGCGIIALMLAQRSQANIDAIDIDSDSIEEASSNFNKSPWAKRLNAHHKSLQNYLTESTLKYDLIVSNPPFFQNSLLPEKENLKFAKHNLSLSFDELLRSSAQLLNPSGRFAVILPCDVNDQFVKLARISGLFLHKQLNFIPAPNKAANRSILIFGFSKIGQTNISSLTIRDEKRNFNKEYIQLTDDFHL